MDALYGYALVLSRDGVTAADLVQETYLHALAAKDRLWQNRAVKNWLFAILRNLWFNQWRKVKKRGEQSLKQDSANANSIHRAMESQNAENPGTLYERKLVHAAIEQLPPEFREVILLREFEEFSYHEIAGILDCPPGTVMSRLARARAKIGILLSKAGAI